MFTDLGSGVYHTPRDDAEPVEFDKLARVARYVGRLTLALADRGRAHLPRPDPTDSVPLLVGRAVAQQDAAGPLALDGHTRTGGSYSEASSIAVPASPPSSSAGHAGRVAVPDDQVPSAGLAQPRDQPGEVARIVQLDLESQLLDERRGGVARADEVAAVDVLDRPRRATRGPARRPARRRPATGRGSRLASSFSACRTRNTTSGSSAGSDRAPPARAPQDSAVDRTRGRTRTRRRRVIFIATVYVHSENGHSH